MTHHESRSAMLFVLLLALLGAGHWQADASAPPRARPGKAPSSTAAGVAQLLSRRSLATTPSYSLRYRGGPVLAAPGPLTVYMIYVGYEESDPEPQWLNYFVEALGTNAWWRVMSKYYRVDKRTKKATYVSGGLTLGGAVYIDIDTFMQNFDGDLAGDGSIPDVINAYLDVDDGVPYDPKALYVLVPADDNRLQMGDYFCNKACGWHSYQEYDREDGSTYRVYYAYVPNQDQCDACVTDITKAIGNATYSPTGDLNIDAMVDTLAHELAEAVTNPDTESGWFGKSIEEENGDVCSGVYTDPGKPLRTTTIQDQDGNNIKVKYNVMFSDGNPVVIQKIWRPDVNPKTKKQYGCVLGA